MAGTTVGSQDSVNVRISELHGVIFEALVHTGNIWEADMLAILHKESRFDTCLCKRISSARFGPRQRTRLMAASARGETERVGWLLEQARDVTALVNAVEVGGSPGSLFTALSLASARGHTATVRLLLSVPGCQPDFRSNECISALTQALGARREGPAALLVADPRVNVAADRNYAIRWASRLGYARVVRTLLADPRVDPCDDGNSALVMASYFGHTEVERLLCADHRVEAWLACKNAK